MLQAGVDATYIRRVPDDGGVRGICRPATDSIADPTGSVTRPATRCHPSIGRRGTRLAGQARVGHRDALAPRATIAPHPGWTLSRRTAMVDDSEHR